ncbi:DUF2917 domain-containing protein [Aromatoleum petrolei]|uniref:DUF2917 domain-containing protein n=1 Tax=Aromatoleum petrolei TaxID=76116 RepID=A0ABX1MP75_9RHOO|nr:DUF2917 domain-containing protein [Aromatoleum petrolei]NMF87834.1 DUF2917 domain-containing protein [Aromatoleum petrolei]QTQ35300.1 putative protein DUF2917 [Aromatoleum petrolei]
METKYARPEWNLQAGGILSIDDAGDWEVSLARGHVWLTLEGYSQDKWLGAGDRFRVPGDGRMVIEAETDARIRLEPPAASAVQRLLARIERSTRRGARTVANATVYSAERISCGPAR